MIKTVLSAMNGGFLQTLKLFAVTLAGALPLGLLLSFCSMSRFKPLKWLTRTLVWIVRGTPLMLQLLILYYVPGVLLGTSPWAPRRAGAVPRLGHRVHPELCLLFLGNFPRGHRGRAEGPAGRPRRCLA